MDSLCEQLRARGKGVWLDLDITGGAKWQERVRRGIEACKSLIFVVSPASVASGSVDNTIRLWDVAGHQQVGPPLGAQTGSVNGVAFSPNGRTLAAGSHDGTIRLWSVANHTEIGAPLMGHENYVTSVVFSPGGTTLPSGSGDFTIRLWRLASQRQIGSSLGDTSGVAAVAFSHDGTVLASGNDDGTIRFWDVARLRTGPTWTRSERWPALRRFRHWPTKAPREVLRAPR